MAWMKKAEVEEKKDMCSSIVPKGVGRYRGVWMEGLENSVGSGENRNC